MQAKIQSNKIIPILQYFRPANKITCPHKTRFYTRLNRKQTTIPKSVLVTTKYTYNNKICTSNNKIHIITKSVLVTTKYTYNNKICTSNNKIHI